MNDARDLTAHYAHAIDAVAEWRGNRSFAAACASRLRQHGDFGRYRAALAALPAVHAPVLVAGDTVTVRGALEHGVRVDLEALLHTLEPWRKGPFELCDVAIDTEWRSDFKWRRVAPHVALAGTRVLDVGCGNGYFGWRALAAGAVHVTGVDPGVLYCIQHLAVAALAGRDDNVVLPATFEELPPARFDVVFSMGVVYHRKDPAAHLARLLQFLEPGGLLVVESLVVESPVMEGGSAFVPPGRYARMNNVHWIPTPAALAGAIAAAGGTDVRVVDVTRTTLAEQRSTSWMRFESLADALDPDDPTRTVEGHPAPVRAVVVARAGGPC